MSADLVAASPPGRQFVAIVFRPGDLRTYTYHNDGEPVAVGDRVMIPGRKGGEQAVTVAALPAEAPQFPTKPIIGPAQVDVPLGDLLGGISTKPMPF